MAAEAAGTEVLEEMGLPVLLYTATAAEAAADTVPRAETTAEAAADTVLLAAAKAAEAAGTVRPDMAATAAQMPE